MPRPPIVGAALWSAVMKKAQNRCECVGACGKKHDPNRRGKQQRCEQENTDYGTSLGGTVLIAMPRDPIHEADFVTAACLPARRLAAMCPECHDAVKRKIKSAVKKLPAQDDGLFPAEGFVVSKGSTRQADVGAA